MCVCVSVCVCCTLRFHIFVHCILGNSARARTRKILKNIPHVISANVDIIEGLSKNKDIFNSKPGNVFLIVNAT